MLAWPFEGPLGPSLSFLGGSSSFFSGGGAVSIAVAVEIFGGGGGSWKACWRGREGNGKGSVGAVLARLVRSSSMVLMTSMTVSSGTMRLGLGVFDFMILEKMDLTSVCTSRALPQDGVCASVPNRLNSLPSSVGDASRSLVFSFFFCRHCNRRSRQWRGGRLGKEIVSGNLLVKPGFWFISRLISLS